MLSFLRKTRQKLAEDKEMKKYFFYAFMEITLVIIGILIALQINNWNESKNEAKQQRAILSSIRVELATNLDILKKAQERRIPFYRSLDSLTDQVSDKRKQTLYKEIPNKERLPYWPGLAPITLNGAMFDAAKYSDALANIDVEILQSLSNTYNKQQGANNIGNTFINKFFDLDTDRDARYNDVIGFMWRIREEFFGFQFILIEEYEASIALIDEKLD